MICYEFHNKQIFFLSNVEIRLLNF